VGPVTFAPGVTLGKQEEVFSERRSLIFKRLQVIRMVDAKRNALVYLTYSDRVIEGSPQNSVTAVPLPPGTVIPLKR
jgi:CreA protein